MAKYKLTVKYNSVCDLSIAGDLPDIIANEFDQYVKSMLYKKEEWENFEANFKLAAKKEYGNIKRAKREAEKSLEEDKKAEKAPDEPKIKEEAKKQEEAPADETKAPKEELNKEAEKEPEENVKEKAEKEIKEKPKRSAIISFGEYIKDKNINTPLDEFVAGACYLDRVLNVKEFSLKQLNAKLFPAFGRLASSEIINEAIDRVLIETIKDGNHQRYMINQNAWNYHNYDLVKQERDSI